MELFIFFVGAAVCLLGAIGVISTKNPVHSALSLVMTLFGIALLFVVQEAHFLAAVQVIVYAGAVVVLFLFVIMLLGVDRVERFGNDPLSWQRPAAVIVGLAGLAVTGALLFSGDHLPTTGTQSVGGELGEGSDHIYNLARSLFTDYVFAFELTSVLLIIAVVGAVILARRPPRRQVDGEGAAADEVPS